MHIVDSAESTLASREGNAGVVFETGRRARRKPPDHRTFRFYVTDSTDKFKRLATRSSADKSITSSTSISEARTVPHRPSLADCLRKDSFPALSLTSVSYVLARRTPVR